MEQTERRYELEAWRQPTIAEDETVIFSEPGRILPGTERYNIDYRSHWFCLVQQRYGRYTLLVKHGGGEERTQIPSCGGYLIEMMQGLDSDTRYRLLHTYFNLYHEGEESGKSQTAHRYREAFVKGTLKKRKIRGENRMKVWIEG